MPLSYCSVATAIRNKKVQAYNLQQNWREGGGERNINVALLVARPPLHPTRALSTDTCLRF